MSQTLSINLPDQLLDRLNRMAQAANRPVEDLVVTTLNHSVPTNVPTKICSIRDIRPISVGQVLRPLSVDNLLDEMVTF